MLRDMITWELEAQTLVPPPRIQFQILSLTS